MSQALSLEKFGHIIYRSWSTALPLWLLVTFYFCLGLSFTVITVGHFFSVLVSSFIVRIAGHILYRSESQALLLPAWVSGFTVKIVCILFSRYMFQALLLHVEFLVPFFTDLDQQLYHYNCWSPFFFLPVLVSSFTVRILYRSKSQALLLLVWVSGFTVIIFSNL